MFIGGLVSIMLESGHALFDVSSTGDYHNMMFENLDSQDRIIIQVRHDSNALAEAKTLGHRMQFTCGYGMRAKNMGKLISSGWRESLSDALDDIGSIMYDVQGNHLFASMPLYIKADDYVDLDTLVPNFDKMAEDISAVTEKLKEFVEVNVGA